MQNNHKTETLLMFVCWCFGLACFSGCTGPTEKQPEAVKKRELPEKADSLQNEVKDGTKVEHDTVQDK